MRTVILQDAAVLIDNDDYKSHRIFDHEIFKSLEFINFKDKLLDKINCTPEPSSVLLDRAMPIVSEKIQVVLQQLAVTNNILNQVKLIKLGFWSSRFDPGFADK